MPSDRDRVIHIPRSDDPDAFVLVYTAPAGRQALKLIGTEGENPYVVTIRKSQFKELRSKNFQGSDEDFENILASVLKHRFDSDNDDDDDGNSIEFVQAGNIEVSASIKQAKDGANQLVIAIRKHIDTITQRVASISLAQDDDQTIELFEWTGLMVTRADSLAQQISSLTERLHAAEESIKSLNSSISELVAGKKEHENLLLANFVQVLNEKKLKIRNQQRLLAAASIDEDKRAVSELKAAFQPRRAEPKSRKGKRKPTEEPSDSDEFERMEVDQGPVDDKKDEEDEEDAGTENLDGPETPQPLEEETESEAEEARSETSSQRDSNEKNTRPQLAQPSEPPPRRDLPFLRKTAASKPQAHGDEDDGGETDDDEL